MAGFIFLIVIAVSAIWVYLDASAHQVGNISDYEERFDKSASFWAIATLFLWPFALPHYLLRRRKLIEIAEKYPVKENLRWLKTCGVTLAAAGFIVTSVAFPGISPEDTLASCGSLKTQTDMSAHTSQKISHSASAEQDGAVWDKFLTLLELPDASTQCEAVAETP